MRERGILFSAPMVRALLDGTKTQRKLYAPPGVDPLSPEHLARRVLHGIREIDANGCWLWGRTTSAGYGCMTVAGKPIRVHRLVLALVQGKSEREIDEACHRCDVSLCCNPDHMFEGTHGDNVRDAVSKGRATPPRGVRMLGTSNGSAKLDADRVVAIRNMAAAGTTHESIARVHGVSQSTVSNIVARKTWRHV